MIPTIHVRSWFSMFHMIHDPYDSHDYVPQWATWFMILTWFPMIYDSCRIMVPHDTWSWFLIKSCGSHGPWEPPDHCSPWCGSHRMEIPRDPSSQTDHDSPWSVAPIEWRFPVIQVPKRIMIPRDPWFPLNEDSPWSKFPSGSWFPVIISQSIPYIVPGIFLIELCLRNYDDWELRSIQTHTKGWVPRLRCPSLVFISGFVYILYRCNAIL